jgi:hypothetical protein
MRAGISIGLDDLHIPLHKYQLVTNAQDELHTTNILARRGEVTAAEKFRKVIDTWAWTSEHVKKEVINNFQKRYPLNPVYMMAFSGARGNVSQVRQLVGMRGLMADPKGDLIDMPIQSNFREGLTIVEYIISCYGSRKGVVDTALRTANSGYLTRRLVEVAQETSIYAITCRSTQSIPMTALYDDVHPETVLIPLSIRLVGRVLASTLYTPSSKRTRHQRQQQIVALRNTDITPPLAQTLQRLFDRIPLRSPFTCEPNANDVCQFCYGWGLQGADLVPLGEAVGVVAAQSIGEPGTQLTMRTFHTGGVFSGSVREKLVAPMPGTVHISRVNGALHRTNSGSLMYFTHASGYLAVVGKRVTLFRIPPRTILHVVPGQRIGALHVLGEYIPPSTQTTKAWPLDQDSTELAIVSERSGQVCFDEIHTMMFSRNNFKGLFAFRHGYLWVIGGTLLHTAATFHAGDVITRQAPALSPELRRIDTCNEVELRACPTFFLTRQNYIYALLTSPPTVQVGDFLRFGDWVTAEERTREGGLVLQIRHVGVHWLLCLRDVIPYAIGRSASLYVDNNEIVQAGDRLFTFYYQREKTGDIVQGLPKIEQLFEARLQKDGKILPTSPKRILLLYFFYFRTRGMDLNHASLLSMLITQCFLLHGIQRVYQSQGVDIADKHLEIIVRELGTHVCVVQPGSTPFMHGEILNHAYLRRYNRVESAPAQYVPLLFGLTKLGLANESFLSAASFQYTRKVLMLSALHAQCDQLTTIKHAILVGSLIPLGAANFYVSRAYRTHIQPHSLSDEERDIQETLHNGAALDIAYFEAMKMSLAVRHYEKPIPEWEIHAFNALSPDDQQRKQADMKYWYKRACAKREQHDIDSEHANSAYYETIRRRALLRPWEHTVASDPAPPSSDEEATGGDGYF